MKIRTFLLTALMGIVLSAPLGTAYAAKPASAAQSAQQNRMRACAAQYRAKKIAKDQYRAFMKTCLKTTATKPGKTGAAQ